MVHDVGLHDSPGSPWERGPPPLRGSRVTAGVRDTRITLSWGGRPCRTLLSAGAFCGSVLVQEPSDVQFFRTRAERPHELGALGVVFGEVVGEEGLRGDCLGPGAECGA